MGCLCAAGRDLPSCLAGIFSRDIAPAKPGRFHTDHLNIYPVFEVPRELFGQGNSSSENRHTLTVLYALSAVDEALTHAGWEARDLGRLKVGVCIGTTVGSTLNNEDYYREYLAGNQPDPKPVCRYLKNNPASVIAEKFGLDGPCQTVVNACSSGTDAIGVAAGWIQGGVCDLVITGGTDELCRVTYNGFASLKIMDVSPCRPFDISRNGLNLGEGAGIMILESPLLRKLDTKNVSGHILGYGSACDAHHLTAPHPEGAGLFRALTQALRLSEADLSQIAFVNAHGTGTKDNDRVEDMVLARVLPNIPFLSTKGYTGHTLGAAGGIEAVLTLGCLNLGRVPGSAGFSSADPESASSPVSERITVEGNLAISQSLAFGGSNAVLVLGKGQSWN
ncbi:Beta-ketoacyl synthase [Desulfonatronospira thiodismutans ASO3-1]|uniref:Beta-ketoacyl synthase n=2 Tax=Desulfonatronospira thiodismutans TaxID=488939 RepID=D6SRZ3_9BACT|nr:Beta-ketoacyl synthase [Desulfonatronospira thiodismutans ASO3-1]